MRFRIAIVVNFFLFSHVAVFADVILLRAVWYGSDVWKTQAATQIAESLLILTIGYILRPTLTLSLPIHGQRVLGPHAERGNQRMPDEYDQVVSVVQPHGSLDVGWSIS